MFEKKICNSYSNLSITFMSLLCNWTLNIVLDHCPMILKVKINYVNKTNKTMLAKKCTIYFD